jgi:hypothetical protein
MPAYVTHTMFSHLCLQALLEAGHPLAGAATRHASLFRVAGIAGCDIQCMPYQVCRECQAPYRHDQKDSRACLACGKGALEDFRFEVADGRRLTRRDVERDFYGNTHLVLYRSFRGYGVRPRTPAGPAEEPFPQQVVDHLTFSLADAQRVAGKAGQVSNYLAFTLGWFSHVVSDALFKGVYPHAARVKFFGSQYGMEMLPAAETLTMSDIAYDWGVHWPKWHRELEQEEPDGGALRHLAMGDLPEAYGPQWTELHGRPDPAIGRVIDAVRPINRRWFGRMYVQPDYSAATPKLDQRRVEARASHRFASKDGQELDLGQLRRYAMGTGWYDTFFKGVSIYLKAVEQAARKAGYDKPRPELTPSTRTSGTDRCVTVGWDLWRGVVGNAVARSDRLEDDWGTRLDVSPAAQVALTALRGQPMHLVLGTPATDYQEGLAQALRQGMQLKDDAGASATLVIGPPSFTPAAAELLCQEDAVRLKYEEGLAGLVRTKVHDGKTLVLVAGLSDFGDAQLQGWANGLTKGAK